MKSTILRGNAVPLYGFLSFIVHNIKQDKSNVEKKILDCGAGGPIPPLAVFYEQDFECWGIDISPKQIEKAESFCSDRNMAIHFRKADMLKMPFENESFGYVYEQYSMCHLTKKDTVLAISEMYRVLQKGGYCFLGLISDITWPMFGEERQPGEYWLKEHGDELVVHSVFSDEEAETLLKDWKIIRKESVTTYSRGYWQNVSLEKWMDMYGEMPGRCTKEEWKAMFSHRLSEVRYDHMFFILKRADENV